ncbi:unnamed protein product [Callosobruchus maculatus]|uniref:Uncharacterized protein n=1 Tax=Callosobruchus maculatus TaxID=64391 RepID=A0A653DU99_CALMS|nr:unnamed protein product [Callosobruchus maculatus]
MDVEKLAADIVCYKILLKRKKKQIAKRKCWTKPWIRRRVRCMLYTRKGVANRGCTTISQFRPYECSAGSIFNRPSWTINSEKKNENARSYVRLRTHNGHISIFSVRYYKKNRCRV